MIFYLEFPLQKIHQSLITMSSDARSSDAKIQLTTILDLESGHNYLNPIMTSEWPIQTFPKTIFFRRL